MKKILAVLMILLVFSLFACANKPETTVCTTTYEGMQIENTIVSTKDKVDSVVYKNIVTVDASLVPYLGSAAEEYAKNFEGLSGITYEFMIEESSLIEITTVDYTKADYKDLVNLGLLNLEDGEVPTPFYIEYNQFVENMKSMGCTCTVK